MIVKVNSIKSAVREVLENYPESRDNDRYLMMTIWAYESDLTQGKRFRDTNFEDFVRGFVDGKYSDPESIRRSRQRIQEQHPHLRGEYYKHRQVELEPEMRKEMPNLET